MNCGKKWFSEKLGKNCDLKNFRSESFSIRTSCIESSRFQARVAKGRPAFRDRITGEHVSPTPEHKSHTGVKIFNLDFMGFFKYFGMGVA